jgi:N-acetylglucosaminyl-diphospho-decaprenol L-rhamnosyltransferase
VDSAPLAHTQADPVTVVIVTYQNRDHIVACLESLLAPPAGRPSRVVVFDNASTDGTADLVEADFPSVQVVRSEVNVGFARGCNLAAAHARTEFILLLNPDTIVQPGCIEALVAVARRRPEAGIYGGRTLRPNGDLDPMSCWGRPTIWSLVCFATGLSAAFPQSKRFNREGLGRWARDTERQVDIVCGCLLMARREVWEALGGFDEEFFMYRGKVTLVRKLWPGRAGNVATRLLLSGVQLRALATSPVRAVVTQPSRSATRTAPSTWSQLWARRSEWRQGWTEARR